MSIVEVNIMNNRGFTLIELLAVIVILSSLSLVVVSSVSSSLGKREVKECQEQIQIAKNAAKIYFSLNDGTTSVTIGALKGGDYFSGDKKTNELNDNDEIQIDSDGVITFVNETSKCNK